MHTYYNPPKEEWLQITQRPVMDTSLLLPRIQEIIEAVKTGGDAALHIYSRQFDDVALHAFEVVESEIADATNKVEDTLKQAINTAAANIKNFHVQQLSQVEKITIMPGVTCWRKSVGIEKVGLYVPGGSAPLFSTVLMLAIPAVLAGCKEIVLCTPPQKDGTINAAILYAAKIAGVHQVYKVGGAQAIAAMALGTQSIPKVHKIFGPGNQYVTCAKQLLQQHGTAIDLPAGPSEVCVLADDTAQAVFIAADLLSQAEHGADSQAMLVTTSKKIIEQVQAQVTKLLGTLPRNEVAQKAINNSCIVYFDNMQQAVAFVNEYAAEHLIISCEKADDIADEIINAGSVFLGNYSPESVGDYASGTNHTLPTNGFAKAYSGVSIDSFVKKITYQKLSVQGLAAIAPTVITMAEAEGLAAHALAVQVRLQEKS